VVQALGVPTGDHTEVEAALAELLALVERPRVQGWSMASALARFAQPQPVLVSRVWTSLRRVLWSLHAAEERLGAEGPALWAQAGEPDEPTDALVAVLRSAIELDAMGDVLATWAVDRSGVRPDDRVTEVVEDVEARLDAAGVPHEPREGPPRGGEGLGRGRRSA